jgi:hypothetical protein
MEAEFSGAWIAVAAVGAKRSGLKKCVMKIVLIEVKGISRLASLLLKMAVSVQ